ncbi:MAG: serine hydrolase [Gemmatimonadota bacterium]|jgi:CubicO group peptidase (beta-lactamase class C family)
MSTTSRTRHALLAAALLAIPVPGLAQTTTAGTAAVADRLEREVEKILAETGIPAISIALVRDGDVAWTGAWGLANVGGGTKATTDTYFSTGSTFKFVTATAVMQLVEKGLLELDAPLNTLVDRTLRVEGADDVTIRHMLSHHSGLEGPVGTVPLWSRVAPRTPTQLLEGTRRTGPPGQTFRYCNECYGIMALIIEKLSGQPYDAYVAEHILQPLGIDIATPSVPSPPVVERMALPYNLGDNKPVPIPQVRYDVFSAGDIYLRAEDMARFLAAQLNGGVFRGTRILSEASVVEMRRQQFDDNPYGLGTAIVEADGHTFVEHGGAIPGFNSFSIGEPASRSGVYVMSNSGQSARAIQPLAGLAMRLMRGENPDPLPSFATEERVEVEIDPAIFDQYVGEYELNPSFVITVTREGGRFFVQATNQPRFEIFASSETDFFLRAVEASITFGRDDPDGPVTHMILHQGGDQRLARRR